MQTPDTLPTPTTPTEYERSAETGAEHLQEASAEQDPRITPAQLKSALEIWQEGERLANLDPTKLEAELDSLGRSEVTVEDKESWTSDMKSVDYLSTPEEERIAAHANTAAHDARRQQEAINKLKGSGWGRLKLKLGIGAEKLKMHEDLHRRHSETAAARTDKHKQVVAAREEAMQRHMTMRNAEIATTKAATKKDIEAANNYAATAPEREEAIKAADENYKDQLAKAQELRDANDKTIQDELDAELARQRSELTPAEFNARESEIREPFNERARQNRYAFETSKEQALLTRLEGPYSGGNLGALGKELLARKEKEIELDHRDALEENAARDRENEKTKEDEDNKQLVSH